MRKFAVIEGTKEECEAELDALTKKIGVSSVKIDSHNCFPLKYENMIGGPIIHHSISVSYLFRYRNTVKKKTKKKVRK